MSDFVEFMAGAAEVIPNKKLVVSKRFKRDGKPIEWEIKALTSDETEHLQRMSMESVPVQGKRGQTTRQLDAIKYVYKMVAASVVYPNLNSASLQASYGVVTPEALLKKMLYPNEFDVLSDAVLGMSESEDLGELIKEAKN